MSQAHSLERFVGDVALFQIRREPDGFDAVRKGRGAQTWARSTRCKGAGEMRIEPLGRAQTTLSSSITWNRITQSPGVRAEAGIFDLRFDHLV